MKNHKASPRHSDRPRAAAFWAIVELDRAACVWLDEANVRGAVRRRLENSILSAATGLNRATAGHDTNRQLARARSAIDRCEEVFLMLSPRLRSEVVFDAISRIDRIAGSLEQLASLPVQEWPQTPLPAPRIVALHLRQRLKH